MSAIGSPVDSHPAKRPERVTLGGNYVSIVPLDPGRHGDALYGEASGAGNEGLWLYLFDGPFYERAPFDVNLERKAASEDPLFYAIVDNARGEAAGHVALMRMDMTHRVIEVGSILYLPSLQRTAGATEAMYLMAKYVFEDLGYRRYEWKCNALNEPSRRAALRLGYTFEGIFRQHMIVKGQNRDTAWFSMIDSEWPSRKAAFEGWLEAGNFDAAGRQKAPLCSFR